MRFLRKTNMAPGTIEAYWKDMYEKFNFVTAVGHNTYICGAVEEYVCNYFKSQYDQI